MRGREQLFILSVYDSILCYLTEPVENLLFTSPYTFNKRQRSCKRLRSSQKSAWVSSLPKIWCVCVDSAIGAFVPFFCCVDNPFEYSRTCCFGCRSYTFCLRHHRSGRCLRLTHESDSCFWWALFRRKRKGLEVFQGTTRLLQQFWLVRSSSLALTLANTMR
jgi:hypothetical protein